MKKKKILKYTKSALSIQGIKINKRFLSIIIDTYKGVIRKGGSFNIRDIAKIETKYKKEEVYTYNKINGGNRLYKDGIISKLKNRRVTIIRQFLDEGINSTEKKISNVLITKRLLILTDKEKEELNKKLGVFSRLISRPHSKYCIWIKEGYYSDESLNVISEYAGIMDSLIPREEENKVEKDEKKK